MRCTVPGSGLAGHPLGCRAVARSPVSSPGPSQTSRFVTFTRWIPDSCLTRPALAQSGLMVQAGLTTTAWPQAQHGDQVRLVFSSFLMLFVELALIRWITANNVYVTEATNFVLLASFLGIGIGFLNATSRRDYLRWTPLALLALVGFVLEFPVVLHSGTGGPLISSPESGSRGRCRNRSASAWFSCSPWRSWPGSARASRGSSSASGR